MIKLNKNSMEWN